jgi:7tm Chemosensory receptor
MPTYQTHSIIWKIFLLFAVYPLVNPYVTSTLGKAHQCWFAWRVMVLTISGLLVTFTYWQRESIMSNKDGVGQFVDTLQYASLAVTSLVVIVENFRKQSCYVKLWKIVGRIQKLGQMTLIDRRLNRQFAIQFWVCFSIYVGDRIRMIFHIKAYGDKYMLQLWGLHLFPLTICNLMVLVHIYYINMLASYFQYVQQELNDVVNFSRYSMFVKIDRDVIPRRLETLKDVHGLLYQASVQVNTIFVWSQGFDLIRIFMQCTCDLHWTYKLEQEFSLILISFIPRTIIQLLLMNRANLCVERAQSLAPLVFQIKFGDEERTLRRMVTNGA